jgi:hypothetical protein
MSGMIIENKSCKYKNPYDLNNDGKVDLQDMSILAYHISK